MILDGENCWEFYPYNGFYFLDSLYAQLAAHPFLAHEHVRRRAPAIGAGAAAPRRRQLGVRRLHDLDRLAGEEPRVGPARRGQEGGRSRGVGGGRLTDAERAAAERQLADCEGSDWFWWMGDYNPAFAVASFDRLYRANLAFLYRLLKLPVPASLADPISRGTGHPELGGTMRRASEHSPA